MELPKAGIRTRSLLVASRLRPLAKSETHPARRRVAALTADASCTVTGTVIKTT
jgi:hypothetical protein